MAQTERKRKPRPAYARKRGIPTAAEAKLATILRLTSEINAIAAHLTGNMKHWRDQPARKSLEYKTNERAALLEALRVQDPARYQAALEEIGG